MRVSKSLVARMFNSMSVDRIGYGLCLRCVLVDVAAVDGQGDDRAMGTIMTDYVEITSSLSCLLQNAEQKSDDHT